MPQIAVPTEEPGGLQAPVSAHFGHSPLFTLIAVENGQIQNIVPLSPAEHQDCLAVVSRLENQGVSAVIALGMGARPLAELRRRGIAVYSAEGCVTAEEALEAWMQDRLSDFPDSRVCAHHH